MSYQVLARKYRPQTFTQVIGQQHVLAALANGLKDNRLHHAYLFAGTRGVGKTSIARLFAKGLNCENGVTAEPCGKCATCQSIEKGNFVDLIEIDAASRTKVEDTRELLDNVQYKPTQGRYKVYLIDEVHMLSRHSFNALLKTLEEPPEYVKFLLATTDPQKLPITILSRCMQFNLKALQPKEISQHLQSVLDAEHIPYDTLALENLAIAAQGSVRDSLSLTDQAIAMGDGKVTYSIVKDMLGLLDEDQPLTIIEALQTGNSENLMRAIQDASEKGTDWLALLSAVTENLQKIAVLQFLPKPTVVPTELLAFLAKNIAPQDVQFFYQILLQGKEEIKNSSNQRMAIEMLFLRALAFHPKFNPVNFYANTKQLEITTQSEITFQQKSNPHQSSAQTHTSLTSDQSIEKIAIASVSPQNTTRTPSYSALNTLNTLNQIADEQKKNLNENVIERTNKPLKKHQLLVETNQVSADVTKTITTNLKEVDSVLTLQPLKNKDTFTEKQTDSVEEYCWQWLNPEMAENNSGLAKLSEIKQTISRRITPAVQHRVIQEACQRDPWTNTIEKIAIHGFVKDMALSTAKIEENDTHITLIIRPEKSYLTEKYADKLQQALRDFYQNNISLSITENNSPNWITPEEHCKRIYQELCEQAQRQLQSDEKLASLLIEFDATLMTESICPV